MEVFVGFLILVLVFVVFFSFILTMEGISTVVEGCQMFFVPFEAKDDENHPKHNRALRLYRYRHDDGHCFWHWVERKRRPWLHMLKGVVVALLFGVVCFFCSWVFLEVTLII